MLLLKSCSNKERVMENTCKNAVEALKRRGYDAMYCSSVDEAAAAIKNEIENVEWVGMGGSVTMKELGVAAYLETVGKLSTRGADCDLFLLSANALTSDGRIVNIDGNGNRVAASVSGPKKVVYAIGRNKIVDGGIDAAITRIKEKACPPNCIRLGKNTPCAATGKCADCDSPDRICKVVAIFDRRPTGTPTTVYIVNADLGY
jgi:L-lactate utilization protein LutB